MHPFTVPPNPNYVRPDHPKIHENYKFLISSKNVCDPGRKVAEANRIYYTVAEIRYPVHDLLLKEAVEFGLSKQLTWMVVLPKNPERESDAFRQAIRYFRELAIATIRVDMFRETEARIRGIVAKAIPCNPTNDGDNLSVKDALMQTIAMSNVFPHENTEKPHPRYLPNDAIIITYQNPVAAVQQTDEVYKIRREAGARAGQEYFPFLWPDSGQPLESWANGFT